MDRRQLLGFGAEEIVATLLRPEHDVALAGRWIVLNLGCEAVLIENDPPQPLLPREGTLVNSVRFQGVGPVLAIRDIEIRFKSINRLRVMNRHIDHLKPMK